MADESKDNKLTIELNLETKDFTIKSGDVVKTIAGIGEEAKRTGHSATESFMGIGAALYVFKEIGHYFEMGVEQMKKLEDQANAMTALRNISASVGVDSEKLVTAIVKASDETITRLDAVGVATKMLKAGIHSEMMPSIVEMAEKMASASGGAYSLKDVLNALGTSVERGTTAPMKSFQITAEATGSRAIVLNSILKQMEQQVSTLGEGYTSTAEKIEIRSRGTAEAVKSFFGGIAKSIGFAVYADDVDKLREELEERKNQLERINVAIGKGETEYSRVVDGAIQTTKIETMRKLVLEDIDKIQIKINEHTAKEHEETTKLNAEIVQKGEIAKSLTQEEQRQFDIRSKIASITELAKNEEKEFGAVSLKTAQDLFAAKKQQIDVEADYEKRRILTSEMTETERLNKLKALEIKHYEDVRKLKIDDEYVSESLQRAELDNITKNIATAENALERHTAIQMQQEDRLYKNKIDKLKMSGVSKAQFDKAAENEEKAHQQRILNIKKSYEDLSAQNLQLGIRQSISQMRQQYGSYSTLAANATKQTHKIMSDGFVNLAKGHGDAMQVMTAQFLEMIGTQLIEGGAYHLMAGIWPPNPVELGQGAAMVAAGSALVGVSAANTPSASGGSGGESNPFVGTNEPTPSTPAAPTEKQMQTKQAQIVINGDFLNSRETANHLAQVLRENSDITDYTITAQGRSYS